MNIKSIHRKPKRRGCQARKEKKGKTQASACGERTLTFKLVDYIQELPSLDQWHADLGEVVVLDKFEVEDFVGTEGNKVGAEVRMDMLGDPRGKIEFCLRRILQEGSLRIQGHRQRISRRYHGDLRTVNETSGSGLGLGRGLGLVWV